MLIIFRWVGWGEYRSNVKYGFPIGLMNKKQKHKNKASKHLPAQFILTSSVWPVCKDHISTNFIPLTCWMTWCQNVSNVHKHKSVGVKCFFSELMEFYLYPIPESTGKEYSNYIWANKVFSFLNPLIYAFATTYISAQW